MKNFYKFCAYLPVLLLMAGRAYAEDVQKPAVAGYFYPKEKAVLQKAVSSYIEKAAPVKVEGDIVAVIAPHAGYQYSGTVAGYAFKALKGKHFKTAVIIAPSHRYAFDGLSVLDKDSYLTPLGKVPIDKQLTKQLIAFDKRIRYYMQPFMDEHAAEVELPFLQEISGNFKAVIILTGTPSYENCILLRNALTKIAKGRNDIILVASTDMSHYLPDSQARLVDRAALSDIENYDAESLFSRLSSQEAQLCGGVGVVGVMMAAKNMGADSVTILNYATSGDATGDKSAVVGYLAAAIYKSSTAKQAAGFKVKAEKEKKMDSLLNPQQRKRLLEIARKTIEAYLKTGDRLQVKEDDPVLNKAMGAFVTLHKEGELRGCIGNIIGQGPLYLTVRDMAIAAASEDPRFPAVAESELKNIDIEISVLSPMEKIKDPSAIIMGKHGVMVRSGFRSGVYLPQVATETGWSRDEFMDSLCMHKAGLAADSWRNGTCDIYIFTAEVFGEKE